VDPDPALDLRLIRIANTLADSAAASPPNAEAAGALRQMVEQQQARLAQRHAAALGITLPPPLHAPAAAAAAAPAEEEAEEAPRNSCVVQLANMVDREELLDAEEYPMLVADTRGEVAKYGKLKLVAIPKPAQHPGGRGRPAAAAGGGLLQGTMRTRVGVLGPRAGPAAAQRPLGQLTRT
jgi:hypothetical protein